MGRNYDSILLAHIEIITYKTKIIIENNPFILNIYKSLYFTHLGYPFRRNNNLGVDIRPCGTWLLSYLV